MSMFPHLTNLNGSAESTVSHEKLKEFKDYTVLKSTGIEELVHNGLHNTL